ncbi:MAG: hypothetical protein R3B93_22500 [Bacteroidia bacterium]
MEDGIMGYICATSFKEFIYWFDMENRIWLKLWYVAELDEVEEAYIRHYTS